MLILGLSAFHADAAACILQDGRLTAAVEEERFRRIKHWSGFPSESVRWCLAEARARLSDVDHIAINQDSRANLWRKIRHLARYRPDPNLVLDRLRTRNRRQGIAGLLEDEFPGEVIKARIHSVEHHRAHLSSAFHVSPFDEAVAVSVDGFGDFASSAWGVGLGTDISIERRVYFPHSLGLFYQAITQYLGFLDYGDEYKVMGMAPYGRPARLDEMRKIVKLEPHGDFRLETAYFRHHREKTAGRTAAGSPLFEPLFCGALEHLLGPRRDPNEPLERRHHDIACSAQHMYEEAFFHLIGAAQRTTGLTDLALAGGCAANAVANGKVSGRTAFRRLFVQPAPGDAGGAIGAAFSVWYERGGKRSFVMDHSYWGTHYSDEEIKGLLDERAAEIAAAGCTLERIDAEAQLCRGVAKDLSDGLVVGWFQGRMEWGPRALGNRSILCDPRRTDIQDILNAKIKRRESFRPFAPSVLEEAVSQWFADDGPSPFMMEVRPIREEKRPLVPAVAHVDGSGRLQTVDRRTNPRYALLIEAFRDATGVPLLLNTSFNENEPIVCQPAEALDCFLRTQMDVLVLEDWVVRRGGPGRHLWRRSA